MITLYGINNCDTIKNTKKWLSEHSTEFKFHDYKKLGCSEEVAKVILNQLELKDVINMRGTTWRELPATERENLDREAAIILMQEKPSVIKRPIIDINGIWVVGFDIEKLSTLIK